MRRTTLIVGVVLLVVGIIIAGVAWVELSSSLTGTLSSAKGEEGSAMYAGQNGDFYSNLLTAGPSSEIIVSFNFSGVHPYLIPSRDLSIVNLENIGNYSISDSLTQGNSSGYSGLNGTYYVVTFGTSSPGIAYIVASHFNSLVIEGGLLALGAIFAIAGIIVVIIGAVRKPRVYPQRS